MKSIALHLTAGALLLSVATARPLEAQVQLDIFGGSALSLPLPMTIVQEGYEDIHFTARWATNPKRATYYYAWRLTLWRGTRGWRFDHIHHKIFLKNPP